MIPENVHGMWTSLNQRDQRRKEKNYILTVIDDYSRFVFMALLCEKSEAKEELKILMKRKENETGKKLKAIRSDNGSEFANNNLREWQRHKT